MKRHCRAVVESKSFGRSGREATIPEGLGDWQFTSTGTQLPTLRPRRAKRLIGWVFSVLT